MNVYLSSHSSKPPICLLHDTKVTLGVPVNAVSLRQGELTEHSDTRYFFPLIKFNYYNYNLFIDPLIGFAHESQNAL